MRKKCGISDVGETLRTCTPDTVIVPFIGALVWLVYSAASRPLFGLYLY